MATNGTTVESSSIPSPSVIISSITSTSIPVAVPSTTSPTSTSISTPTTTSVPPTSTVTASSIPASTTNTITSTISTPIGPSSSLGPVIVTITTTSAIASTTSSSSASASSSSGASLANNGSDNSSGGGLTPAGRTAIAVVIPVVVVAALVFLGLWFWRRRKQQKAAAEERRKEVEDYGYNPNSDPTIPVVGAAPAMSEDNSGYRGWGAAAASTRKASTTLSGGHAQQLSDGGSNAYGNSPHHSDGNSNTGLMDNRRQTMGSDDFTATPINNDYNDAAGASGMGAAVAANGMRRGPSNASSRYSGGALSDGSQEPVPQIPQSYENHGYGYTQHGPYGDGSYSGGGGPGAAAGGMPVVRDVSARRNTRVQQAGNYPAGNSGIAQNF